MGPGSTGTKSRAIRPVGRGVDCLLGSGIDTSSMTWSSGSDKLETEPKALKDGKGGWKTGTEGPP